MVLDDPTVQEMGVFATMVPSVLDGLIDPKSISNLESIGGAETLIEKLHTNAGTGLSELNLQSGLTIEDRRRIYGENRLPQRKNKTFLQVMRIAYQDRLLVGIICYPLSKDPV